MQNWNDRTALDLSLQLFKTKKLLREMAGTIYEQKIQQDIKLLQDLINSRKTLRCPAVACGRGCERVEVSYYGVKYCVCPQGHKYQAGDWNHKDSLIPISGVKLGTGGSVKGDMYFPDEDSPSPTLCGPKLVIRTDRCGYVGDFESTLANARRLHLPYMLAIHCVSFT